MRIRLLAKKPLIVNFIENSNNNNNKESCKDMDICSYHMITSCLMI